MYCKQIYVAISKWSMVSTLAITPLCFFVIDHSFREISLFSESIQFIFARFIRGQFAGPAGWAAFSPRITCQFPQCLSHELTWFQSGIICTSKCAGWQIHWECGREILKVMGLAKKGLSFQLWSFFFLTVYIAVVYFCLCVCVCLCKCCARINLDPSNTLL